MLQPGMLEILALSIPLFSENVICENQSNCIKTAAPEVHNYYRSLLAHLLGLVLLSQPKRSVLQ